MLTNEIIVTGPGIRCRRLSPLIADFLMIPIGRNSSSHQDATQIKIIFPVLVEIILWYWWDKYSSVIKTRIIVLRLIVDDYL